MKGKLKIKKAHAQFDAPLTTHFVKNHRFLNFAYIEDKHIIAVSILENKVFTTLHKSVESSMVKHKPFERNKSLSLRPLMIDYELQFEEDKWYNYQLSKNEITLYIYLD